MATKISVPQRSPAVRIIGNASFAARARAAMSRRGLVLPAPPRRPPVGKLVARSALATPAARVASLGLRPRNVAAFTPRPLRPVGFFGRMVARMRAARAARNTTAFSRAKRMKTSISVFSKKPAFAWGRRLRSLSAAQKKALGEARKWAVAAEVDKKSGRVFGAAVKEKKAKDALLRARVLGAGQVKAKAKFERQKLAVGALTAMATARAMGQHEEARRILAASGAIDTSIRALMPGALSVSKAVGAGVIQRPDIELRPLTWFQQTPSSADQAGLGGIFDDVKREISKVSNSTKKAVGQVTNQIKPLLKNLICQASKAGSKIKVSDIQAAAKTGAEVYSATKGSGAGASGTAGFAGLGVVATEDIRKQKELALQRAVQAGQDQSQDFFKKVAKGRCKVEKVKQVPVAAPITEEDPAPGTATLAKLAVPAAGAFLLWKFIF